MKTWNAYKEHAKSQSLTAKQDIEEIEALSSIVSALVSIYPAWGRFFFRSLPDMKRR